ncbi:MAG: hypothetical protein ACI4D7_10015 [Lachnospiraceae bacterium]
MTSSLTPVFELRDKLIRLYAKRSKWIQALIRFVSAFLMLQTINSQIGYIPEIMSLPVVLGISLVCCILPWSVISILMCVLVVLEFLKVSVIVTGFCLFILLCMLMVDLMFAPGYNFIIFFVPLAFFLKLPFLVPLILGLAAPLTAVIPMLFGLLMHYMISYVSSTAGILADTAQSVGMYEKFVQMIEGVFKNQNMLVFAIAFSFTAAAVYLLRRLSVNYAWIIAVAVGSVLDLVLVLFGIATYTGGTMSVPAVIIGSVISGLIALAVQFMIFSVDYKQTEYVQFEDDDYYYYVKAIPKVKVADREYDKKDFTEIDSASTEE